MYKKLDKLVLIFEGEHKVDKYTRKDNVIYCYDIKQILLQVHRMTTSIIAIYNGE